MACRTVTELRKLITEIMSAEVVTSPTGAVTATIVYDGERVRRGNVARLRYLTYLSVPALSWEVRERGAAGKRTVYVMWLGQAIGQDVEHEAGTVTAQTIAGEARHGTLRIIEPYAVINVPGLSLTREIELPNDEKGVV